MARIATSRIAWTYTDDAGYDWRVAAVKGYTDQAVLGGSAALGSVPPKPAWLKMRRTTVNHATYGSRTVPLYDGTQTMTQAGETIDLNHDTDSYTFEATGSIIAEKRPRQSVTKDSA